MKKLLWISTETSESSNKNHNGSQVGKQKFFPTFYGWKEQGWRLVKDRHWGFLESKISLSPYSSGPSYVGLFSPKCWQIKFQRSENLGFLSSQILRMILPSRQISFEFKE